MPMLDRLNDTDDSTADQSVAPSAALDDGSTDGTLGPNPERCTDPTNCTGGILPSSTPSTTTPTETLTTTESTPAAA